MTQDLFSLKDKIALITGSGRGIGYTLAKGLGQAGATVILNDIDSDRLNKSIENLIEKGVTAHHSLFDVRNESDIDTEVRSIEKDIGPIDILINNAGIQIRGPLENFNLKDWQNLMDINLTGAFLTTKAVVTGMIERKAGKIINICSIQSELARPTIAPYTAAKGGLKMLTRGMATRLPRAAATSCT